MTERGFTKASSARAVDLLAGAAFTGFQTLGVAGALGNVASPEHALNSELRLLLKRLGKRDAVTKAKTLKGLIEFLAACPDDDITDMLAHWPRLYTRLCLDSDRIVRTITQQVMGQLALRAKKELTPYFKELIGTWLAAQCDSSRDVSEAARAAFDTVFPDPDKRARALAFGAADVLVGARAVVLDHTPASLNELASPSEDPFEVTARYEHAVTAHLRAAAWVCSTAATAEAGTPVYRALADFVSDGQVLRHAKCANPQVVAGLFELLAAACISAPHLVRPAGKKVLSVLFQSLTLFDGVALRAGWSGVVAMLRALPESFDGVNPRKAVWPLVWALLKDGGRGAPDATYGQLLPFFRALPSSAFGEDRAPWHAALFGSLCEGAAKHRFNTAAFADLVLCHNECLVFCHTLSTGGAGAAEGSVLAHAGALVLACPPASSQREAALRGMAAFAAPALAGQPLLSQCLVRLCVQLTTARSVSNGTPHEMAVAADANAAVTASDAAEVVDVAGVQTLLRALEAACESPPPRALVALMADVCAHALGSPAPRLHVWEGLLLDCALRFAPHGLFSGSALSASPADFLVTLPQTALMATRPTAGLSLAVAAMSCCTAQHPDAAVLSQFACYYDNFLAHHGTLITLASAHIPAVLRAFVNQPDRRESLAEAVVAAATCFADEGDEALLRAVIGSKGTAAAVIIDATSRAAVLCVLGRHLQAALQLLPNADGSECRLALATMRVTSSAVVHDDVYACVALPIVLQLAHGSAPACVQAAALATWMKTAGDLPRHGPLAECCAAAVAGCGASQAVIAGRIALIARFFDASVFSIVVTQLQCQTSPMLIPDSVVYAHDHSWWFGYLDDSTGSEAILPSPDTIMAWALPAYALVNAISVVQAQNKSSCILSLERLELLFVVSATISILLKWLPYHDNEAVTVLLAELGTAAEHVCGVAPAGDVHAAALHLASPAGTPALMSTLALRLAVTQSLAPGPGDDAAGVAVRQRARQLLRTPVLAGPVDTLPTFFAAHSVLMAVRPVLCVPVPDATLEPVHTALLALWQARVLKTSNRVPLQSLYAVALLRLTLPSGVARPAAPRITPVRGAVRLRGSGAVSAVAAAGQQAAARAAALDELLVPCAAGVWRPYETVLAGFVAWQAAMDGVLAPETAPGDTCPEDRRILCLCIDTALLFNTAVMTVPAHLNAAAWDFVLCTTVAWLQVDPITPLRRALLVQACSVVRSVASLMTHLAAHPSVHAVLPATLARYLQEWHEFFRDAICERLLVLFLSVGSGAAGSGDDDYDVAVSQTVGLVLSVPYAGAHVDFAAIVPLLWSGSAGIQVAAHTILSLFVQARSSEMAVVLGLSEADDTEGDGARHPLLMVLRLDREWPVLNDDGDGSGVLSLLLSWLLCFEVARALASDLRARVTASLRTTRTTGAAMAFVADLLLPAKLSDSDVALALGPELFSSAMSELALELVSARVAFDALATFPALVRQWYVFDCRRKALFSALAAKHFSPIIIQREMTSIQACRHDSAHLVVRVRPVAGEIVCLYTRDALSMELVVALAKNHPLDVVTIACRQRLGVASGLWERWMREWGIFVSHLNGSLMSAILQWKSNIDKRFDGAEECVICYSIVHGSNYKLPSERCKTCKNHFHKACLYTWFSTSTATCPLCRAVWI